MVKKFLHQFNDDQNVFFLELDYSPLLLNDHQTYLSLRCKKMTIYASRSKAMILLFNLSIAHFLFLFNNLDI